MATGVTYWRGSASSAARHLRTSRSGSASSNSICSGCVSSSQSSGLESPVPRWSRKTTSRESLSRVNSGITSEASEIAPCPGPPAITKMGSGSRARAFAGITATRSVMRRPLLASRFSQTSWVPHRAAVSTPASRQSASAMVERGESDPEVQAARKRTAAVARKRKFISRRVTRGSIAVRGYHSGVETPSFPKRDPAGAEFWDLRYAADFAPWDAGRVPAQLREFVSAASRPRSVLVPGCGSAWDVRFLAESGWKVVGIDFSHEALGAARRILGPHVNNVRYGDFFARIPEAPFEVVYERAFLCALPRRMWGDWGRRMAEVVQPGGTL